MAKGLMGAILACCIVTVMALLSNQAFILSEYYVPRRKDTCIGHKSTAAPFCTILLVRFC